MAEWLQMAASLVSVLMLCGVIFNFSVIKPLNESVRSSGTVSQNFAASCRIRKPSGRRWRNGCPGWKPGRTCPPQAGCHGTAAAGTGGWK